MRHALARRNTGPRLGPGLAVLFGLVLCSACTGRTAVDQGDEADASDASGELPPMDFLGEPCDPFADECPADQKCAPIAIEPYAHIFVENRCVALSPDPVALDDECYSWGLRPENYDNCERGLICWGARDPIEPPPETTDALKKPTPGEQNRVVKPQGGSFSERPGTAEPAHGTELGLCRALCQGSASEPHCSSEWGWCVNNNGTDLCVHTCNPLDTNCDEAHNCLWDETRETLNCLHQPPSTLPLGADCTGQGFACERGLTCDPAASVPGCETEYCCNTWCSTDGEVSCGLEGQICEKFWPAGGEPPGQALLGRCTL